jgi:hypothetical protein
VNALSYQLAHVPKLKRHSVGVDNNGNPSPNVQARPAPLRATADQWWSRPSRRRFAIDAETNPNQTCRPTYGTTHDVIGSHRL